MTDKDVALAIMQAALAIAGLLLVFAGFLFARAEEYETLRGDKYKLMAKFALIPLLSSIFCALMGTWAAIGGTWSAAHLITAFYIVLGSTAAYAIVAILTT